MGDYKKAKCDVCGVEFTYPDMLDYAPLVCYDCCLDKATIKANHERTRIEAINEMITLAHIAEAAKN